MYTMNEENLSKMQSYVPQGNKSIAQWIVFYMLFWRKILWVKYDSGEFFLSLKILYTQNYVYQGVSNQHERSIEIFPTRSSLLLKNLLALIFWTRL